MSLLLRDPQIQKTWHLHIDFTVQYGRFINTDIFRRQDLFVLRLSKLNYCFKTGGLAS